MHIPTFHNLHAGLSLVQMLVSLAIIAVLAALLLAAVPGFIKRADAAKCVANLRQLHAAGMLRASEHGGRLQSRRIENSTSNRGGLPGFREYLGYDQMVFAPTTYTCPATQKEVRSGMYMHRTYAVGRLLVSNYGREDGSDAAPPSKVNGALEYLQRVPYPSRTLYIGGGVPGGRGGQDPGSQGHTYSVDLHWDNYKQALYPYNGTMMVVFVDGHVKAMRPEDLAKPRDHALWGGQKID
jgi:prepilin-type processing-associated H-X9-DG protein